MNVSVPGAVPCEPKRPFREVLDELRRDMGFVFAERTLLALVCRWLDDPQNTKLERTVVGELLALIERSDWMVWEQRAAVGEVIALIENCCG